MTQTPSPDKARAADGPPLRAIRRAQLQKIVPLADTTIYEMERRGEFPRRFALTRRCVVWDLAEVETWLAERKRQAQEGTQERAPLPDVRDRKTRPVRNR
ncbi:MAG: AlpA family transcriptional regulator [Alphaproteobacteria bacterium]|jgi:prophage regulatory protein|nr:AlpA family transcriptional regulator [Alphaproteobacteria bacterium]